MNGQGKADARSGQSFWSQWVMLALIVVTLGVGWGVQPRVARGEATDEDVLKTKVRIRELELELAREKSRLRRQLGLTIEGGFVATPMPLPESVEGVEPVEEDGNRYPVSDITIVYAREHPGLPAVSEVMSVPVDLVRTSQGFIAPRADLPGTRVRLWDLRGMQDAYLYGSALRKIAVSIVADFNRQGLVGVFVGPDPAQINTRGEDLRGGNTSLTFIVRTAVISEVRSMAAGDRFQPEERINNPAHARLVRNLPISPSDGFGPDDVLNRDLLDRYVARLNRHPSRRVDVAVASADSEVPGEVALDLLVAENRPWNAYFQISNTGTTSTDHWRYRFGAVHNQLTNNDDVLSIDYITAGFDKVHSVLISYEAPVFDSQKWRWGIHGAWSHFTADDVGFANTKFQSEDWSLEGRLIYNLWQNDTQFLDIYAGLRGEQAAVENQTILTKTVTAFLMPFLGLNYQNYTETTATSANIDYHFNLDSIVGTDEAELALLGRGVPGGGLPDADFDVLSWRFFHSFYLEPIFNREAWEDVTTPDSSTLAHEMTFTVAGQTGFTNRLHAQEVRAIGGVYSVRGYREAEISGDSALTVSAEYRLHVPRLFAIQPDPSTTPLFGKPFRWSPQNVYGRPDWDLVLKAFFDYGAVWINRKGPNEMNETLMSVGAGIELAVKRNLIVRVDFGVPLEDGPKGTGGPARTDRGDVVTHVVATLMY